MVINLKMPMENISAKSPSTKHGKSRPPGSGRRKRADNGYNNTTMKTAAPMERPR